MPEVRWRYLLITIALVIFGYLFDQLRTIHILADEPVSWECTSHTPMYPKPVVLLRFMRAPDYFDFEADPDGSICRFFAQSGKAVVIAHTDVWGSKHGGFVGWNEITYDGRTAPHTGNFGADGQDRATEHPFPYSQDFDTALHRHHP